MNNSHEAVTRFKLSVCTRNNVIDCGGKPTHYHMNAWTFFRVWPLLQSLKLALHYETPGARAEQNWFHLEGEASVRTCRAGGLGFAARGRCPRSVEWFFQQIHRRPSVRPLLGPGSCRCSLSNPQFRLIHSNNCRNFNKAIQRRTDTHESLTETQVDGKRCRGEAGRPSASTGSRCSSCLLRESQGQ